MPEIISIVIKHMNLRRLSKCLYLHTIWFKEISRELHLRRNLFEQEYKKAVEEYKLASDELDACYKTEKILGGVSYGPLIRNSGPYYKRYCKSCTKKEIAFSRQVAVERHLLRYNLINKEDISVILYNIMLQKSGYDPYEIPDYCEY